MATDTINISLSEVTAIANKITSLNDDLSSRLEQIKTALVNLESTWSSDASQTIVEKMNQMDPRFKEYKEVVESYSQFLHQTVQMYDDAETQLQSYASSFN